MENGDMSESTNEALPATLADLVVRAETRAGGGSGIEVLVATWGGGTKTLELKEMDLEGVMHSGPEMQAA